MKRENSFGQNFSAAQSAAKRSEKSLIGGPKCIIQSERNPNWTMSFDSPWSNVPVYTFEVYQTDQDWLRYVFVDSLGPCCTPGPENG